ncbi:ATP-grasp domain-containing protein [Bacillus sp. DX4.1]|uniref:ATP-grasp domain-containing protein n=1 Tax=Bacillus sp. DX4.1 TaxID=3055867 RepID=UPI0025A0521A|nr:ATP-grasp domain-containing protein [Bacillus sp. DX4.1]MDM5185977.1 ATP-grasp domain-containing protein [Bacillus sp. DX4.1]
MTIVLLNRVSKEKKNYIEWLKDSKEQIIILNHKETLHTFDSNVTKKGFDNFSDNGLVDLEVIELHNKKAIKALIALEESEIIRAASLRQYLNIEGQHLESALHFRDKFLMKSHLQRNGVKIPNFRKINNRIDLIDFIEKEKYPVIVKPRSSWSSKGIHVLYDKYDLKKCLLTNTLEDYLVEKYIEAPVFHVDGLILNNKIEFICSSAYINTCLSYRENIGMGSVLFEEDNEFANQLMNFVEEALFRMPLAKDMSFHVEVFYDKSNEEFLICEMGSRTIGAGTDKLFEYSFNLDFDKIITQAQSDVEIDMNIIKNNVSGQLFIPPKKGFLMSIPQELPFEWCFNYEIKGMIGTYYGGSKKSTDSYAVVYFEGRNQDELLKRAEEVEKYIVENTIWEFK